MLHDEFSLCRNSVHVTVWIKIAGMLGEVAMIRPVESVGMDDTLLEDYSIIIRHICN